MKFSNLRKEGKLISKIRLEDKDHYQVINTVENALREGTLLLFSLKTQRRKRCTQSLSYVDGKLNFIGEERNDRCLVYVNTKEINKITLVSSENYKKNFP